MPKQEYKHAALECEWKEEGDSMIVEGYASIFGNVDAHRDIVEKGAFGKTLRGRQHSKIKMLKNHMGSSIAGVWEKFSEDSKGLYAKGRLIDTAIGRDAYVEAKEGALDGLSIGYMISDSEYDSKKNIRLLKELDLFEVSLVTFPANTEARLVSVKTDMPESKREFEEFLRDAGFSRSQAKKLVSGRFGEQADIQRDVELKAVNDLKGAFESIINLNNNN